jgi:hypothetical protein
LAGAFTAASYAERDVRPNPTVVAAAAGPNANTAQLITSELEEGAVYEVLVDASVLAWMARLMAHRRFTYGAGGSGAPYRSCGFNRRRYYGSAMQAKGIRNPRVCPKISCRMNSAGRQ